MASRLAKLKLTFVVFVTIQTLIFFVDDHHHVHVLLAKQWHDGQTLKGEQDLDYKWGLLAMEKAGGGLEGRKEVHRSCQAISFL